jgi:hypothetical protein
MISLPADMLMGKTSTRWVDGYGYELVLPVPIYPWVKYVLILAKIKLFFYYHLYRYQVM